MTTIRADVDNKFIRRFLFVAIGCFLLMLWGLYDGMVTMPREMDRSIAYQELVKQQEAGDLSEAERAEKWDMMTEERGWPSNLPDSPEHAKNDIYFQWFLFGLGLVLGLFFLLKYVRLQNSWVEADDDGVATSWGQELQFKDIQSITKHKWEKKGIAKVEYKESSGASKTIVLDDFKYSRKDMGAILERAEKDLSDEQIVGGTRESAKSQELAAAAPENEEVQA